VIYVHKYFTGNDALSQNITWSVSVEEQFYLFWPLLFVILPKKYWGFSIFSVIIFSLIFRLYHFNDTIVMYYHTFSVLIDLALGALMAYLIKSKEKIRLFFENTSTRMHILLFSFSFCMILWGNSLFDFDYGPAIVRFFISFSFALIVSAQAFTTKLSVFNLGRLSFPSTWGRYTYGIYLLHPIAITFWDVIYRVIGIPKTGFTSLFSLALLSFLFTLVLSKFSFLYFESKFLVLKERFTS
jgi:peptidoglycan/LPS O-acetylase OafA/YrhL